MRKGIFTHTHKFLNHQKQIVDEENIEMFDHEYVFENKPIYPSYITLKILDLVVNIFSMLYKVLV
jgi:hypothetical protein